MTNMACVLNQVPSTQIWFVAVGWNSRRPYFDWPEQKQLTGIVVFQSEKGKPKARAVCPNSIGNSFLMTAFLRVVVADCHRKTLGRTCPNLHQEGIGQGFISKQLTLGVSKGSRDSTSSERLAGPDPRRMAFSFGLNFTLVTHWALELFVIRKNNGG